MESPQLSESTTSSATLFIGATPEYDDSNAVLDLPLHAKFDSTVVMGCIRQAVSLAPTPLPYISDLRYSRRDKLNYDKVSVIKTVPHVNRIPFRPDTVGTLGWKAYEHPEGSVYFRAANFCTNLWLYDPVAVEAIEKVAEQICATLSSRLPELSGKDIEFGLDLIDDEEPDAAPEDKLGCYYAVDNTSQEVFWLHEVGANFYCDGAEINILSREHLRCGAKMGYWDHCYMFPHGRSFSSDTVGDVRAMLSYNMFDKVTSSTSTAPYNEEDARRLFQIFRDMEATESSGEYERPEHVVMIARMQSTFLRDKLLRFHGERYAQLDSNKSVFEDDPKDNRRSELFEALSWLFFFRPRVYFEQLSRVWVDNKVNYDTWHTFIGGLQDDWAAYIVPASIVLTANIAFLAVQSIDQGGFALTDQTVGQTASYVSALLNVGCVAASLILAGQHRLDDHRSASDTAVKYLCDRGALESKGGVERLAVLYSAPAAFFRWGLVSFATAIFWLSLQDSSMATRITVCVVAGISILLLIAIAFNGEWKPRFSASPLRLASGMRRVRRLVTYRASAIVGATRAKFFSKPKEESILPK